MRLSSLAGLIVIVSWGLISAAPVPKAKPKHRYFPTEIGTKWVYKQGKQEWTDEITKVAERDGATWLAIRKTEGGKSTERSYSVGENEFIWRKDSDFTIDRIILKFPPKKGETWTVETPIQKGFEFALSGIMTVGAEEEITVPAGKYKAFPVMFELTAVEDEKLPKPTKINTAWYAENVGLVMFRDVEGSAVRDLISFVPPPKK